MKKRSTKIILVEPMGPINLGSVARLCENFGVDELRLVSPLCSIEHSDSRKMALKGKKLLETAKHYSTLLEAISDCPTVIATCGRKDHGTIPLYSPQEALNWLSHRPVVHPIAIVFGREDRGLTNEELLLANKVITLNTYKGYPSLNLSHAVAIVLHELNKYLLIGTNNSSFNFLLRNPAPPKQLNDFLQDAENILLDIGFLLNHTAKARMQKLRILFQRAELKEEEVSLLRGIIRQTRWAINKNKNDDN